MVDLEISSDNMVTLLAHKARTVSRAHIVSTIAKFRIPSIAFTFRANCFPRYGAAMEFGQ